MTTITTASTTITTVTTTKTSTTDPTDTTTIPSDVLYGDINLDGSISVIDVIYLNKYLAGIIQFNSDQLSSADCVNDNVINSSDATSLLKYTVGKLTTLPVNVAE
ncbi:MAG: dockerin type I repeat-containing protein [Ruminococcus sp.]